MYVDVSVAIYFYLHKSIFLEIENSGEKNELNSKPLEIV